MCIRDSAHGDRIEMTGILARFAHTFAAVVSHHIGSDGTLLAGRADDVHHIAGILAGRALAFCKTHPLTDDCLLYTSET